MARSFSWLDPAGGANKPHCEICDTQNLWTEESVMKGYLLTPFKCVSL